MAKQTHNAERWIIRDRMPFAVLVVTWETFYVSVLVHDNIWLVPNSTAAIFDSKQDAEQAIAGGVQDTERILLSPEGFEANMVLLQERIA